jgi:hypothetical protein
MKDADNKREICHYYIIIIIIRKIYAPNEDRFFNAVLFSLFHVSLKYSFITDENQRNMLKARTFIVMVPSVSG